ETRREAYSSIRKGGNLPDLPARGGVLASRNVSHRESSAPGADLGTRASWAATGGYFCLSTGAPAGQVRHLRRSGAPSGRLFVSHHRTLQDQSAAPSPHQGDLRRSASLHESENAGGPGNPPTCQSGPHLPMGIRAPVPLLPGRRPDTVLGKGPCRPALLWTGVDGGPMGAAALGTLRGAARLDALPVGSHAHRSRPTGHDR